MRIALATRHAQSMFMPLALLYLKASVANRGCAADGDVEILEFGADETADDIATRVLLGDPDLVGLSCYVWNITAMLAAAARIKARLPNVPIVLGGPEVGPVAADVLARNPQIDVIVKSEGEGPLPQIVEALARAGDLAGVPGICFRRGADIVDTGEAPLLKDLGEVTSPHFTWNASWTDRAICIETQRGCVFRCSFCFYNKDFSVRNRRFDLDRVKEEIRLWLDRDIRELYLMDPVFNLHAARAKEICRFIGEHNHRKIPLHAEIWAEFVDDELAGLMADANFRFLEVGLQTTDTTALKTADRRLKMQPFIAGIGHLKRHKIPFQLQLIYGLPGETRDTFRESLNFSMALDPDDLAVFPLMILPGTELWRHASRLQLEYEPEPPYFLKQHLSMSAADVDHGGDVIKACHILGQSRTMRLLSREPGLTFADLIEEWIAWRKPVPRELPEPAVLRQFVAETCARHDIPPRFYEHFAAAEFS